VLDLKLLADAIREVGDKILVKLDEIASTLEQIRDGR
jgi:hypothetical protein